MRGNLGEADWRTQSKCSKLTTSESDAIFFPPPGGKSKKAEAFCSDCPVRSNCLTLALAPGTTGFFAGTTEGDRDGMRKFVDSIPASISETMPKEPKTLRKKLRNVVNKAFVEHPLDSVEGPSMYDEMAMIIMDTNGISRAL